MLKKTNSSLSVAEKQLGRSTQKSLEELDKMISKMEEKVQNSTRHNLLLEEKLESIERVLSEDLRLRKAVEENWLHDLQLRMLKLEATMRTNSSTIIHDDYQPRKSVVRGAASYHASLYCHCSLKIINVIKNNLHKDNLEKFKQSCFGPLLQINQLIFQGQLMLHLLLHLDMGVSKERLLFKINNTNTEFGPNEFFLITRLRFGTSEATTTASSSKFHDYVFQGRSNIMLKDVEATFLTFNRDHEGRGGFVLKLALLYFLYGVLLVSRGKIDMRYLHLVDDLHKFNAFPWGRVVYQSLFSSTLSVRTRIDASKLTHRRASVDMYGFSYALQVWVYEVMPSIATHCALRANNIDNLTPRILCWFAMKIFRFDDLKQFFTPGGNAHLVLSGIRDSPEQKNIMVKGGELSIDTMQTRIKEKCDDVGVIKRRRPGFEDSLESSPRKFDRPILDISSDDDEAVKKAEQPASATTPIGHTKPQLLWKECSDFEISESDYERSKVFYERLLSQTKRLRLWINYTQFEAFAMKKTVHESGLSDKRECLHPASAVFERGLSYFRTAAPELKEERAMLLEEWLDMENNFGQLGDVDLVRAKLPRKLKKRRHIEAEDAPTRYEEYVEYIFPEETPQVRDVRILETAYKWKIDTNKTMKVYDREARSQQRGILPFTLSKKHMIAAEDD